MCSFIFSNKMSLISPDEEAFPVSERAEGQTTIVQLIIGITLALILVEFWRIFLEAFIFVKLGVQKNSAFQTLIVAIALTLVLLIFVNFVQAGVAETVVGLNVSQSYNSKTQRLLEGDREDVPMAEKCSCRDCDSQSVTDVYNPNIDEKCGKKNKCKSNGRGERSNGRVSGRSNLQFHRRING
jgi:hypothetical protein